MASDKSELSNDDLLENASVDKLPRSALQAIYHAVTGKTESLSKILRGNVVISAQDFNNLYERICDQLELYNVEMGPTVSVVVKHASDKSVTYSSWERFQSLRVQNHEITSEIILRLEFVITLPQAPGPQRCIINVNLDSSLPVLIDRGAEEEGGIEEISFLFLVRRHWASVKISIDFVDFLVAKSFVSTIEEWFQTLKKTPRKPLNDFLYKKYTVIQAGVSQLSRIGMAAFLFGFYAFSPIPAGVSDLVVLAAVGLSIWSVIVMCQASIMRAVRRRISANVVPSVILLNDADCEAYDEVKEGWNSAAITILGLGLTVLLSIASNLISSFLYSYYF
ncbi:hypothetical protein [Amorphus coralli]|uniref:hypothetical protein n=1 Tax=Amorphus coralli TaxID=340680 RepID=UPI0012ECABFB|nr:hypothetical protein [Amorphus coralli]